MSAVETKMAGYSWPYKALYQVGRFFVCGYVRVVTRLTIDGRENLPLSGGYVIAPVHRSYIDTMVASWVSWRRIRFMGKDTIWKHRRFGELCSALGAFPVTRGSVDREALTRCISVLEAGEPLVLFPEGERKDGPTVHPMLDGAAFVAAKAGVPIVPMGIGGSARAMPRKAKFIYPRKVHAIIGKPIYVETNESGRASRDALTAASDRLRTEIQRLYDEAESIADPPGD